MKTKKPAVGHRVDRRVRPLRVAATILVPLLMIAAGTGVAALMHRLEQSFGGQAVLLVVLACLCGWIAWNVWNWPDWRRDDEA